ncbi:MAG: FlgD immunoglobulin-like domain containing protein, partial [Candidatus Krumholzibacteria bacterium]|nr:FlgD immunoglobulin-like domain containing protein [Candidatus Krumholzibacteria bacterium]
DALQSLSYPRPVDRIEIIFLPLPLREHSHSFARGNRIFLAPAEVEIPEEITHMTVVHELGHLFQYAKMSDMNTSLWSQYRQLRRISNEDIYHDSAIHANRPHEIFAEDFRYLFGGDLANYSGTIENHDLSLPDEVFGLREFFLSLSDKIVPASLLQASCFPNPFNPRTTVKVDAEVDLIGETLTVRVFDAQGRQVRELYRGTLFTQSLSFQWDGRDNGNRPLPSGVYFSRIRVGDHRAGSKMILLQ